MDTKDVQRMNCPNSVSIMTVEAMCSAILHSDCFSDKKLAGNNPLLG